MPDCAVIGAGAAGLAAARHLRRAGIAVSVFDKGRRCGGRIARRHTAQGSFEHGAPSSAVALPWLLEVLATGRLAGAALHTSQRVATIKRSTSGWQLAFTEGQPSQHFDAVIVTLPAPQLAALLPQFSLPISLQRIVYAPCWTLLWTPDTGVSAASLSHASERLVEIIREDLKPGDTGPARITAHAAADWSQQMLECDADRVRVALLTAAAECVGISAPAGFSSVHRWRYARVAQPLGSAQLSLAPGLHYASDGCIGNGVAGAVESGLAAAQALLDYTRSAP